jgi:hypothetical protein
MDDSLGAQFQSADSWCFDSTGKEMNGLNGVAKWKGSNPELRRKDKKVVEGFKWVRMSTSCYRASHLRGENTRLPWLDYLDCH